MVVYLNCIVCYCIWDTLCFYFFNILFKLCSLFKQLSIVIILCIRICSLNILFKFLLHFCYVIIYFFICLLLNSSLSGFNTTCNFHGEFIKEILKHVIAYKIIKHIKCYKFTYLRINIVHFARIWKTRLWSTRWLIFICLWTSAITFFQHVFYEFLLLFKHFIHFALFFLEFNVFTLFWIVIRLYRSLHSSTWILLPYWVYYNFILFIFTFFNYISSYWCFTWQYSKLIRFLGRRFQ